MHKNGQQAILVQQLCEGVKFESSISNSRVIPDKINVCCYAGFFFFKHILYVFKKKKKQHQANQCCRFKRNLKHTAGL